MVGAEVGDWVGNQEHSEDGLSAALVTRVAATFDLPCPASGQPLPLLWHWAFFQEPVAPAQLGRDGHPARGGFLPPAEGRNRMWAGGRVDFLQPLRVDVPAARHSTIAAIEEKQGRTGKLLFVTVRHDYIQQGETCIQEEQDIVYREPSPPRLSLDTPLPEPEWAESIRPTPVMLFRYSAVTFNGHRIHYDWPYATATEGYPGLVVHGPMIATLLVQAFCNAHPHAVPTRLTYRGLRPLIADSDFQVAGRHEAAGRAALWAFNEQGPAHEAEIHYKENG
ncbi:MaoC family dehydratase N-terminal domain-containing protein [Halomonas sp. HP20-15]|uniref:FAS1-like dehydratase domain-containing protein n=1 Tax=Halomonas sp. HP20-15 TaxID=3085901 RepID=UPI0029826049|nr:MaoC family dehydratase N-terminal domain-containing protein [Halomonas sp. HP20-15]MDW5375989.1 MaoC family dehydratase N-terminal domain-containing protein [Halomonas sp. HP20-15]